MELEWSDVARNLFGVARDQSVTWELFLSLLEPKYRARIEQSIGDRRDRRQFRRVVQAGWRERTRPMDSRTRRLIKDEAGIATPLSGIFLDIGEEKLVRGAEDA